MPRIGGLFTIGEQHHDHDRRQDQTIFCALFDDGPWKERLEEPEDDPDDDSENCAGLDDYDRTLDSKDGRCPRRQRDDPHHNTGGNSNDDSCDQPGHEAAEHPACRMLEVKGRTPIEWNGRSCIHNKVLLS